MELFGRLRRRRDRMLRQFQFTDLAPRDAICDMTVRICALERTSRQDSSTTVSLKAAFEPEVAPFSPIARATL